MTFQLSEEHLAVRQAARDFAQQECLPGVIELDELQRFPKEQVMQLADLGFMGMMVDEKYGGSGMDTVSYVLAMEEVSKVDASVSVCMSVNNSLVCYGLQKYGTEEQKPVPPMKIVFFRLQKSTQKKNLLKAINSYVFFS